MAGVWAEWEEIEPASSGYCSDTESPDYGTWVTYGPYTVEFKGFLLYCEKCGNYKLTREGRTAGNSLLVGVGNCVLILAGLILVLTVIGIVVLPILLLTKKLVDSLDQSSWRIAHFKCSKCGTYYCVDTSNPKQPIQNPRLYTAEMLKSNDATFIGVYGNS